MVAGSKHVPPSSGGGTVTGVADTATAHLALAAGILSATVLDAPTLGGLTKAQVAAAALAASPPFGELVRSGQYTGDEHTGRSTLALTLQRLYIRPFRVSRLTTFDRIAAETTTAAGAGGILRYGVWADAVAFNWPGNLLADVSLAADDALGIHPAVINLALVPGLYWRGVVAQVAAATVRSSNTVVPLVAQVDPTGASQAAFPFSSAVAGALASNPDPSAGIVVAGPLLWMRAA